VAVVSGLARGIDGAAHVGALQGAGADPGPPVAVVGTGPDVVYPASNAALWASVAAHGAVLSESPLGSPPRPRAFPARNRIIAALADVVVVVECHHRGGSLHTAEAAARRGIPVGAVPGSVRSPASRGTNGLLVDGCIPVRDAADALVAVSLATGGRTAPAPVPQAGALVAARGRDRPGHRPRDDDGPPLRPAPPAGTPERAVFDAVDTEPTPVETVLLRTGLSVAAAAEAAHRLVASGHLGSGAGWWSRR
jgi:DNA processing protein